MTDDATIRGDRQRHPTRGRQRDFLGGFNTAVLTGPVKTAWFSQPFPRAREGAHAPAKPARWRDVLLHEYSDVGDGQSGGLNRSCLEDIRHRDKLRLPVPPRRAAATYPPARGRAGAAQRLDGSNRPRRASPRPARRRTKTPASFSRSANVNRGQAVASQKKRRARQAGHVDYRAAGRLIFECIGCEAEGGRSGARQAHECAH